jgi:hypothetical protein
MISPVVLPPPSRSTRETVSMGNVHCIARGVRAGYVVRQYEFSTGGQRAYGWFLARVLLKRTESGHTRRSKTGRGGLGRTIYRCQHYL